MLVSCICVTERRPEFIKRAVACFDAQTHEEKELVIVDSFYEPSVTIPAVLKPEVVYLRCPNFSQGRRLSLGMHSASGALLQKWDDDDVYGPEFLANTVKAYQENSITYLRKCLIKTQDGEVRVREGRMTGGSIMISREVLRVIGGVSDVPNDVDGDLFRKCLNAGVPFNGRTEYFEDYTYVRHDSNTWNGMFSRQLSSGEIEHKPLDEAWLECAVYEGSKREEVLKCLR